jgi:UDP:flavonoid glycosyltransferase YjiC (YdhE family)
MKLLLTAQPTRSHISPMLPLVDAAVRAGHDVSFVTGAEGIPIVSRPGVRPVALGPSWAEALSWYRDFSAMLPPFATPDAALSHFIVHLFGRYTGEEIAPALTRLVATMRPDIVISSQGSFAGRTAATLAGVPHVVHGFGPQQSIELVPAITEAVIELQAPYGIPAAISRAWNDDVYIDIWPAVLDDGAGKVFHNVLPVRSAAVRPALPADAVLDGLPHPQSVYVTLGSMFNTSADGTALLRKFIEAFKGAPVNAIVTVGQDGDPGQFRVHGSNVRVERFVPQEALLPYVDAVLSHGGAGTAIGALSFGTPHVMTPVATDQHRISARVARSGSGIALDAEATSDQIRAGVSTVLNAPAFADAARKVASTLHVAPDAQHVLAQIETLTDSRY